MPVYLCQAGTGHSDPWKSGILVYAAPFPMFDNVLQSHPAQPSAAAIVSRELIVADLDEDARVSADWLSSAPIPTIPSTHGNATTTATSRGADPSASRSTSVAAVAAAVSTQSSSTATPGAGGESGVAAVALPAGTGGVAIRRIRHAEIVLVDDVSIDFGRFWLRLRWPGYKGGFAGYIAMMKTAHPQSQPLHASDAALGENSYLTRSASSQLPSIFSERNRLIPTSPSQQRITLHDSNSFAGSEADPQSEEEGGDDRDLFSSGMPPLEPIDGQFSIFEDTTTADSIICIRTGLAFPSSSVLQLLSVYDDGISPVVAVNPFTHAEPVFCRICRESLHEDADDEQPDAAEDDRETITDRRRSTLRSAVGTTLNKDDDDDDNDDISNDNNNSSVSPVLSWTTSVKRKQGPIQPSPKYSSNAEALRNPFLSPCECSGSMAFVHYLCVEQWRRRSRHPDAHNGLNCETCKTAYALPPPTDRPTSIVAAVQLDQEDWLEAMPPHVMQALRQPHLGWVIGAALVRRRWLRPITSSVLSPMVALYCRARRFLKKRGVARRRWACSLCRRRARWKCVRCLRSYYCSRQCQNVSWHIVHKHVCYKPIRQIHSVVVYTVATLYFFPGLLRDPLLYDMGIGVIPVSFQVMSALGGGLGLLTKKVMGIDIRGRWFELIVVLATMWLSFFTWGLVKGFYGMSSTCYGVGGFISVNPETLQLYPLLRWTSTFLLSPFQRFYSVVDALPLYFSVTRRLMCVHDDDATSNTAIPSPPASGHDGNSERGKHCFAHAPRMDFYMEEHDGQACAGDLHSLISLYLVTCLVFLVTYLWKHQDRVRRHRGDVVGARPLFRIHNAVRQLQRQHRHRQRQQHQD